MRVSVRIDMTGLAEEECAMGAFREMNLYEFLQWQEREIRKYLRERRTSGDRGALEAEMRKALR